MKKMLLALPLALLAACGSGDADSNVASKDVLMSTDIDGLVGWLPDASALTKGEAHSGQYCLRVDQGREFSPGYNTILGQLSETRLRGVRLEAWSFAPDKDAAAKLELVVKDAEGKELLRDQTVLTEVGGVGKWVKISKEIILPPTANYSSQLIIYMSRAGSTGPAYVDDIRLLALR